MSAYIVSENTISVIVKGFDEFKGIAGSCLFNHPEFKKSYYTGKGWKADEKARHEAMGQILLNQNYDSVNYRYQSNNPAPAYCYKDLDIDPGMLVGCIDCYEYQACETPDYMGSDIQKSLSALRRTILNRLLEKCGYEKPWGFKTPLKSR